VVLAAVVVLILQRLPPADSPFAPLDLEQPLGWATGLKLRALRTAPATCQDLVARASLAVTPVPDRRTGDFCGFTNVVTITRSQARWSAPVSLTCAMAAALYVWEREVVAPAAIRHFGSQVVRIDQFGTYACRRVNNASGPSARPSQHATANAIDVAGFHLADGTRITLAGDWSGDNPAKRAFLREVRDGSCRLFAAVLSPDYNAAHADHFHFDMGPYSICR
jgi:hypothetical protein